MKVFVSHISEEAPLALKLKEWIESTFVGQCDVFVRGIKVYSIGTSYWTWEEE